MMLIIRINLLIITLFITACSNSTALEKNMRDMSQKVDSLSAQVIELKKQQLANDKITDTIKDTATQAISAAEQANERIDNFVASYKK